MDDNRDLITMSSAELLNEVNEFASVRRLKAIREEGIKRGLHREVLRAVSVLLQPLGQVDATRRLDWRDEGIRHV